MSVCVTEWMSFGTYSYSKHCHLKNLNIIGHFSFVYLEFNSLFPSIYVYYCKDFFWILSNARLFRGKWGIRLTEKLSCDLDLDGGWLRWRLWWRRSVDHHCHKTPMRLGFSPLLKFVLPLTVVLIFGKFRVRRTTTWSVFLSSMYIRYALCLLKVVLKLASSESKVVK